MSSAFALVAEPALWAQEREFARPGGRPALGELSVSAHSLCFMSCVSHPSSHRADRQRWPEVQQLLGDVVEPHVMELLETLGLYILVREKSGKAVMYCVEIVLTSWALCPSFLDHTSGTIVPAPTTASWCFPWVHQVNFCSQKVLEGVRTAGAMDL